MMAAGNIPVRGAAQGAPSRPTKRSFSNGKTSPAHAPQAKRQASQEELVDAVLGDAMNEIWSQTDEHYHDGEFNHVINLSRIVAQGDPHNMEAYANPAYLLWSTGRSDEAEAILKQGLEANPNNYYMYDELGTYWLIYRKDPKAAIPFYEKAVKFDCPFAPWNSLANCYEKTDQLEKAIAAWERGTLYPGDAVAIVRLKRARARLAQAKHD